MQRSELLSLYIKFYLVVLLRVMMWYELCVYSIIDTYQINKQFIHMACTYHHTLRDAYKNK